MDPIVPAAIAGIIPLIGSLLSALLISDKLSAKVNALIALVAIIAVSLLCEFLTLGTLPGNKAEIFLGVLGYVAVFMRGDLGILYNTFLSVNSSGVLPANPNPIRVKASFIDPSVPPRASRE